MRFTTKLSKILSALAVVGAAANALNDSGLTPAALTDPSTIIAIAIAIAQAIQAQQAHIRNPDGAPATEPYVPPGRKVVCD